MGLGIEVEAGVISEEAGVVEEMAGVISTKASREAKMVVLAMVSKTSLEVPMVIMVKPIGLELLSVSIVKKQKADKTDHWPSQCQLLGNILSDWHAGESQSGHQDHQGNSSGQH